MKEMPYKVLIIGCGKIAGGFDLHLNLNDYPCTHAGAYTRDTRFELVACVEPDNDVRALFAQQWNINRHFSSVQEAQASDIQIDVISICSPTGFHKENILHSLELKPRLILCEKPLGRNTAEAALLIDACKKANILLAINYNRRWDICLDNLKQAIEKQEYGTLRSVVGFYNKGILNNGSHLLDLLHFLLGDLVILGVGQEIIDYNKQDPTVPVLLKDKRGIPIHLVTGHAQDFSFFEAQFIFSEAVLTMRDGGMTWTSRSPRDNARFAGYKLLGKEIQHEGGYLKTMLRALDNIYHALTDDAPLKSTGDSALKTQEICEKISEMALSVDN